MLEDNDVELAFADRSIGVRCYQFLMRACNDCDGVKKAGTCPSYFPVGVHGCNLIESESGRVLEEF